MNQPYANRKYIILLVFISVGLIFVVRLFYLQGIDDKWKIAAHEISENKQRIRPERGEIYDRNGALLVANVPVYDLLVTPGLVKEMDTLSFCELVGITKEGFMTRMAKAKHYTRWKASAFEKQIPAEEHARIREQLYKYPGFEWDLRILRGYPDPIGPHALGYIGEVNQAQLDADNFYRRGDYIGINGIEKYYENQLRGQPGVRYILRDAFNNEVISYKEGRYDTMAIPGTDLYTTLDAGLQAYGEWLMENKKGSIVAIEPATGEILAMVSSPTYDPNLLIGRDRSRNYAALAQNDSLRPLFNRATMAPYPPGSIFKLVQALIGLQDGVLFENSRFPCNKALVGCHDHSHSKSIIQAIQHSCNPYFYSATQKVINKGRSKSIFKDTEMGLAGWKTQVQSFGLGRRLQIDLPNIKGGYIPGVDFYDRMYGKGRWAYSTIRSISIGQGEVQVIPIQMANLAAIVANEGWYYTPHLAKKIARNGNKPEPFRIRHTTTIDPKYFLMVKEAMRRVVQEPGGTARLARINAATIVCGKTGTAQNPHGKDHSVFIAFAPMDHPRIAIAVFIENAGFGGTYAAPVASLMIDKYINDTVSDPRKEKYIREVNLIDPK